MENLKKTIHLDRRPPTEDANPSFLFICRPGFEKNLLREIQSVLQKANLSIKPQSIKRADLGLVHLTELDPAQWALLEKTDFVFERQRMAPVASLEIESLKTVARKIIHDHFPTIDPSPLPWTLHAFTPDVDEFKSLRKRVGNIEKVVLEQLKKRFGKMFRRYAPPPTFGPDDQFMVAQFCMDRADHVYVSIGAKTPRLHSYPGGEQRMKFDPDSPSRSYLKICEAAARLPHPPASGETAVDLGAAPGGWTHYLLKQGCRVTAVDKGAVRIKNPDRLPGVLEVPQTDGMTFAPRDGDGPFDWLCCDMLRPPSQTLELLLNWIDRKWTRNFIVIFKLPQNNPVGFVEELRESLNARGLEFYSIKQLYHNREEITACGKV